jgi:uncharacterized protein YebE (UPF0316 family)
MELNVLLMGVVIFIARVCDVSIGTVRTIVTVHGRSGIAFFLGLIEISLWLAAASAVIVQVRDVPILGAFYVLGYATGNFLGIQMERKIAFGSLILRVITAVRGNRLAGDFQEKVSRRRTKDAKRSGGNGLNTWYFDAVFGIFSLNRQVAGGNGAGMN